MPKPFKLIIMLSFVFAACMAVTAVAYAAPVGLGTVTVDALKLRESPNTNSKVLEMAYKGDSVVILESNGEWLKVSYEYNQGYMFAEYITVSQTADANIGTGKIDGSVVNIRNAPSTDSPVVVQASKGEAVNITGIDSGWYKVSYKSSSGYIHGDYLLVEKVQTASRSNYTSSGGSSDSGDIPMDSVASPKGEEILNYAKQFLGVRYVYGGSSPNGFDCSGFTQYVMKHFGISLNRTASDQLKNGVSVSKAELQVGDLVFFKSGTSRPASHVGIYAGNNSFIHATSPGDVVSITSLSMSYYAKSYIGARRVI